MWHFVPCGCQLRIIHFFLVWYLSSISFCVLPSGYLFNILILASFYRFSWFRCLSAYFFLRIRPSHEGRSFWTPVKAFLWKDQCEAIKLFFFFTETLVLVAGGGYVRLWTPCMRCFLLLVNFCCINLIISWYHWVIIYAHQPLVLNSL